MPEAVPIVEIMQEYAEKAISHAQEKFGIKLDYSEQSLVDVDGILSRVVEGELFRPDKLSAEEKENLLCLCNAYGGYLGEVMVRHIGATWHSKDLDDGSFTTELTVRERFTGSPPDRIWKRLTQSEFDTVIGYYRGVQHLLGLAPFVPAQFKKPSYVRKLWQRITK
jgi:hypothetical protein